MKTIAKIEEEVKDFKANEIRNNKTHKSEDFKGKNVITFGTFDFFHIGHKKIIDNALSIAGSQENLVISVSSDKWNSLKGKKAEQNQNERMDSIKKMYPKAKVILEDHLKPEESWPSLWDEHNISLIVMGGDHADNLAYLNGLVTPGGNEMKISFFERTPLISSTLIRKEYKS